MIHVHSVPDFEVFAALIPKFLGAKCVLDIHDIVPELYLSKFKLGHDSLAYKMLLLMERLSTRFSDHVIAANDIWGERLQARSVGADKCSVFLNYPDQDIFAPRVRHLSENRFVFMYPGTLSWHQGLDIAIRALAAIAPNAPMARLEIYGDGTERASLETLAKHLEVSDRVSFRDFLPIREIADRMANANVGIVPKRADTFGNEAFSTKILEFMSLGVPVLAARTAIDTYYFDDNSIYFFDSGDEESLAKAMLDLVNNRRPV